MVTAQHTKPEVPDLAIAALVFLLKDLGAKLQWVSYPLERILILIVCVCVCGRQQSPVVLK